MTPGEVPQSMRLNRFLARAGVGSRREVEDLIRDGRVRVNGEVRSELATIVHVREDEVTLDGKPIDLPLPVYYKCYKPRGVVSTLDDPQGRDSLHELLAAHDIPSGVVSAGRLDRDSEGLLLLSNDGDTLQRLTHPRYQVTKVYRVLADRRPTEADLKHLREGVRYREYVGIALQTARMGPQPPDDEHPQAGYWLEITMGEGRKREIREMLAALRYRVLRLVRIGHGPVQVGTLRPGEVRPLTDAERRSVLDAEAGTEPTDPV